ncbi:uncharacterized protein N0V89_010911 [Didymosphaeria variabile]|uniref:COP9 signalosome complex subunit 3 n=1 Tax=Didymosphaeria variabile TaxID=1932322 RepID=A0A9W8XCP0_9PLEO|nr:uncharacterized protein N0V89_010911 [Didymosphaeria variabile]KAJ4346978.1 hypothetical protein N0V89_010911 [Didymosphaeria variabile]
MSAETINSLLSFQPDAPELQRKREYDREAREFVKHINGSTPVTFLKGADSPQDPLNVLDPTTNAIAYAYTLRHRIEAAIKQTPDQVRPGGSLWNKLVLFLESFDPIQMRYAGEQWRKLVDYVEVAARNEGAPALAIAPIRSAMFRLDPTTGTFTSTHLRFIQLCMETRSYKAALPVLNNYIHSLPAAIAKETLDDLEYSVVAADSVASGEYINLKSGHTAKISLTDLQEYYVLGAMAYLGERQVKDALHFLEHVLVTPANNALNGLMLEAYKKWVLISCLADKSYKTPPRTMSSAAVKHCKNAAKAYEALAEAFQQLNNLPKLKAQVNAGSEIWAEDGNTGLVEELLEHQNRAYLSRLSRTFSAIPVSNIASNVGSSVDQVTTFVGSLIQQGLLNARLEANDKSGAGAVLRFYLDPTQGPLAKTEKQQQQALFEQTQRTDALAEQVKDADYRLSITKEYVEYVKRQKKKNGAGGGGGADAMDMTFDDGDMDEDIMGDMR